MKKNKIFSIIGACFMVALACLSFIVPLKSKNTAGAYYVNSDPNAFSIYLDTPVTIFATGYDITSININNGEIYKNINNAFTGGFTNTHNSIVTRYNINDYYKVQEAFLTFAKFSLENITEVESVYTAYLNSYASLKHHRRTEIYFYFNLVGENFDLSVTNPIVNVSFGDNTINNISINNGSTGSAYTGSYYFSVSSILENYSISLADLLKDFSITYTFDTTLDSNTNVAPFICYSALYYGDSLNNFFGNLVSNDNILFTVPYDCGGTNLYMYYQLGYNNSSTYFSTYWSDYYKSLYDANNPVIKQEAYNNGYNAGYAEGAESASILPGAIMSFATLPFSILSGFLNFDLFGFNLYTLVLSLCTLLLCIWLIKKIKA